MSMDECSRRTSIDLDQRGYFVVEEISEDDDNEGQKVTRPPESSPTKPEDGDNGKQEGLPLTSTISKPLSFDPLRREFGNISPISEDFSESDKETDENNRHIINGNTAVDSQEDLDDTTTSTTAVVGDRDTSLILNRLNCSSPILAQSPSLRKTPVVVAALEEAEAFAASSPSHSAAKVKKLRNFARALDDISDRDEDDDEDVVLMGYKDSDDDEMMDEGCSFEGLVDGRQGEGGGLSEDEEKTESFEIDLNNSSEGRNAAGECGSPFSMKTSESCGSLVNKEKGRTVWETLSDNIETHINEGNNAGFVSGPIDHPIHVSKSPEPTGTLVMSLEELELTDDEPKQLFSSSRSQI